MDIIIDPTDYELDLPANAEEIKKELYQKTDKGWVTANLSSHSAWVKDSTKIWFRSRFIYLMPSENNTPAYATARIIGKETDKDTRKVLSAFLASLSWVKTIPLSVEHWSGGGRPNPIAYKGSISLLISSIDRDSIQDPQDEKARLALAFYREGLSTNNIFYSFLSFFKIINMINNFSQDQINWINSKLDKLSYDSQQRLQELKKTENDIGKYLYKSGRCAVAHAWSEPIADPDDPDDQERLRKDKILIEELSIVAIEEEFDIKSCKSLHKDRNHRIQKLLNIFDKELLEKGILKTEIPFIKLGIRGKEPNQLTDKLYFSKIISFSNKAITIDTQTQDCRAIVRFSIDTVENDLFIDTDYAVYKLLPDHDRTNAEIDLNALILLRDYSMNGQIRIYSPEGKLLASSTPYRSSGDLVRGVGELNEDIEAAKLKLAAFDEACAT